MIWLEDDDPVRCPVCKECVDARTWFIEKIPSQYRYSRACANCGREPSIEKIEALYEKEHTLGKHKEARDFFEEIKKERDEERIKSENAEMSRL